MRVRSSRPLGLALVLLLLSVASFAASASPSPRFTADLELLQMAEGLPGFGGLFYDADGHANLYLLDPGRAPLVKALGQDARILQGRFDFRDLYRWRGELRSLLAHPGVVLLDIDETRNRIRLGIEDTKASTLRELDRELAVRKIPQAAVLVEPVPGVHRAATVQDRFRPVRGGLQIAFSNFLCTLGFNANRLGVAGFVTNSHCSGQQGGVQNTVMFQNTNAAGNRIGIETVDPFFFTGGSCPAGRACRFSDSSFASYDAAGNQDFGKIARPTGVGSLTLSGSAPFFNLVGTANFPVAGQVLNKVGRTTGWSRGTVNSTCVDINFSNGTTILCQDIVNAAVQGGDSGSPVFSAGTADSDTGATLYGILWGCLSSSGCETSPAPQFIMSSWQNILADLGTLSVIRTVTSVNAASFTANTAPDSIVAAFGTGLATTTASASSGTLPTSLAGTTIKLKDASGNTVLAPLFFVSPNQINYLMPALVSTGRTPVTATRGDGTVSTRSASTPRIAPGLFSANGNGGGVASGQILRVKGDGSQTFEPLATFNGTQWVPLAVSFGPSTDTLYLILYGTGVRNRSNLSAVSATVGDTSPAVLYAGPQGDFVGEDQINVGPLPRSLAGGQRNVVLTVISDVGVPVTSNTVTVTFQP